MLSAPAPHRAGNGPLGTDSNTKARGLLSAKLMMGTETFDEEPTNKSIVKRATMVLLSLILASSLP